MPHWHKLFAQLSGSAAIMSDFKYACVAIPNLGKKSITLTDVLEIIYELMVLWSLIGASRSALLLQGTPSRITNICKCN